VKAPYPTTQALAATIRADDDRAIRYVIATLRRCDGNVSATATALGCSVRVLYNWRDANKRLAAAFEKHALGREGAGPNATRARMRDA